MAGKKGVKALLDEKYHEVVRSKIFLVGKTNVPLIWANDFDELIKFTGHSWCALKCRSTGSGISFNICYPYEHIFNENSKSKHIICFNCESCGLLYQDVKRDIISRGKYSKMCGRCIWREKSRTPERREKNSKAQLIAQNRVGAREKMSKSVSNAWKRDYTRRCESIRKAFAENQSYRKKISEASLRNWRNEEYAEKILTSSAFKTGTYYGIFYQSCCELAFILWCEENNRSVKRFNGVIPYHFNGKNRSYRPDFLVDDKLIVEVKHSLERETYLERLETIQAKNEAAREYAEKNGLDFRLVEVVKDIKNKYREAIKIHEQNSAKTNLSLQG